MGLFMKKTPSSLKDLFWCQVGKLYDAEQRLRDAIPELADAARDPALKSAFREDADRTGRQAKRLEQIFDHHGRKRRRLKREGIRGLIGEGSQVMCERGDPHVRDAALIALGQQIEHYKIAGYGSAHAFADLLGDRYAAGLLQQTLQEEGAADRKLAKIATSEVNPAAQQV
jgi:ferritin-like metal-binding protein YciE